MYLGSLPAYYTIYNRKKVGQHQLTARLGYLCDFMCAATQLCSVQRKCCRVWTGRFFPSRQTLFPSACAGHYFSHLLQQCLILSAMFIHSDIAYRIYPCTISLRLSNLFNMVSFIHYMWLRERARSSRSRSNLRNSYTLRRPRTL